MTHGTSISISAQQLLKAHTVLRQLCIDKVTEGDQGQKRPIADEISVENAAALYRMVLEHQPKTCVEVGMAFGVSSVAILAALDRLGGDRRLISIDPNQSRGYGNCGVGAVRRAGFASRHELIEEPSYLALPRLCAQKREVNLGYIDGWHTFDYTLLDFFYLDKAAPAGAVIGFNDCGWRSVHRVVSFVASHRRYEELDAGLKPIYHGRNIVSTLWRRFEGRSSADRYFKKSEAWEPNWNFYRRF